MSSNNNFKSVLIAGATGYVGQIITNAFLKAGWSVSILTSPSSVANEAKKATFDKFTSAGAKVIAADISKPETYASKIKGIDVVISALGVQMLVEPQIALVKASKEAGVKLFLPSEYGLDVAKNPDSIVFAAKIKARNAIESSGINYAYIITGPFYEYLYGWPAWGIDIKNNKVTQIGDRSTKVTAVSIDEVVEFLPQIVNDPTNINKHVVLGHKLTTGEIYDEALAALKGRELKTEAVTVAEIQKRIDTAPSVVASIPDRLLIELAKGVAGEDNNIDGSKYGKEFSRLKEFVPKFVEKVDNGTFTIDSIL